MAHIKHRLERLEKAKTSCGLTPAEALELGRMIQGSALIPGKKYPGQVGYEPDDRDTARDEHKDKRLEELLAKLKSGSRD